MFRARERDSADTFSPKVIFDFPPRFFPFQLGCQLDACPPSFPGEVGAAGGLRGEPGLLPPSPPARGWGGPRRPLCSPGALVNRRGACISVVRSSLCHPSPPRRSPAGRVAGQEVPESGRQTSHTRMLPHPAVTLHAHCLEALASKNRSQPEAFLKERVS